MKRNVLPLYQKRLDYIALFLKEMRFAEGKNQDGFVEVGVSRRQIQRAEHGCNLTLVSLFSVLDCYGYKLSDLDCIE